MTDKEKFVLRDQPFIEIKVRAYRTLDEKTGRGIMSFSFEDTTTHVKENDIEIGDIAGGMGSISLTDNRRKYKSDYMIKHNDLWYAFQKALEKAGDEFKEGMGPDEDS